MKIAGLDIGTNSLGIAVRDSEYSKDVTEQLEYFNSIIFKSGVLGGGKNREFSYAAQRTSFRTTRNLYKARKYRIWETLRVLIQNNYCPLSMEDLDKWRKYDKAQGLKREYPVNSVSFTQWIQLDFNGDGIPDYFSPYQLRSHLVESKFDLSTDMDRFKLGRALYHIAQRRGFKSSKGMTMKDQERSEMSSDGEIDVVSDLKKSEIKKSSELVKYMSENNFKTVGQAFADLEIKGCRVRNSIYQAVRSQYKDEVIAIFEFQKLDLESDFCKNILSEKKYIGSIFYKRPLRSQKGLIGKCTLEPNKYRCPISHPEFEKFRAWTLINNIKFGPDLALTLSVDQKNKLFNDRFLMTRANFKFEDIRKWIEKEMNLKLDSKQKTINYKDNVNVSGCPVSGRLKNILGSDWESWIFQTDKDRVNKATGVFHSVQYTYRDIWHVCFSFDEAEYIVEFSKNNLDFNEFQIKQMVSLWGAVQQGYAMLSLKAISNINKFLVKGVIYTDAVLLAKLPELFKEKWAENEDVIVKEIGALIDNNRNQKQIFNIVNGLIANYKSLDESEVFAYKNYDYILDSDDKVDILKVTIDTIGSKTWGDKNQQEQSKILSDVETLYQRFFNSSCRDYYKLPKLSDSLVDYLGENYDFLTKSGLMKIYHPSMIEYYSPAKETELEDGRKIRLLGSPVIGALKNPMAMRVLHNLRRQCNSLLLSGVIDENTRMVVETARDFNDANMRWAIRTYQEEREKENKEYKKIIEQYYPGRDVSESDIDKARILCEHNDILEVGSAFTSINNKSQSNKKLDNYKKDVTKYRLWMEQGCRCIYTGKIINIQSLFNDNAVDFEHTIPRSISFDDSLANLTVCDSHFNRSVKKNMFPSQLENYNDILFRIQPWIDKVGQLKDNVNYWKSQSKWAQDKDRKDHCICQRHLWQMELDYWQNKVDRFTTTEVTNRFRNNQLNDTRIITKYAYHYLKTVFQNVVVQKGSVTASFRKILGVQSLDEKKNRDKHSHHAIDAAILTLIPSAAKRDRMLEKFYLIQEKERLNQDVSYLKCQFEKELKDCRLPSGLTGLVSFIENNILVNHVSRNQALTPAVRKARSRGKEVFVLNKHGEAVNKWLKGDCIRGELHGATFYGAIKIPSVDEKDRFIQENGKYKYKKDKEGNDIINYVVRKELKFKKNDNDTGFKSWDELEKAIVNKSLINMMKMQFEDPGILFKDAVEQGIWMLDKHGNKVNRIRHIRCNTRLKKPLDIKNHTYLSKYDYKQSYHAEVGSGSLYTMCKYEDKATNKKEYVPYNLFDISRNRKILNVDIPEKIEGEKSSLSLCEKLVVGDMLLLYKDSVDELLGAEKSFISNRLYVVRAFEKDGKRIVLQKNSNAQSDKLLGDGRAMKDFDDMPEKIRCRINTIKYLILGQTCSLDTAGNLHIVERS